MMEQRLKSRYHQLKKVMVKKMKIEKFKTLLLLLLIFFSIYQTGQLWLQPFSETIEAEEDFIMEDIYLWDKIKPEKISIINDQIITTYKEEYCEKIWLEFIEIFSSMLEKELVVEEVDNENLSGIKIFLPSPMPNEFFLRGLDVENKESMDIIKSIKSFYVTEDRYSIIIENKEGSFIKLTSE